MQNRTIYTHQYGNQPIMPYAPNAPRYDKKSKKWIIAPIVAGGAVVLGGSGALAYSLTNNESDAHDFDADAEVETIAQSMTDAIETVADQTEGPQLMDDEGVEDSISATPASYDEYGPQMYEIETDFTAEQQGLLPSSYDVANPLVFPHNSNIDSSPINVPLPPQVGDTPEPSTDETVMEWATDYIQAYNPVHIDPAPLTPTGPVTMSHAVNDQMTFDQAFAAARQDVGPGGVFMWHGSLYNTYTVGEWNAMTPEQIDAFASNSQTYHDLVPDPDEPDIMLVDEGYDDESGISYATIIADDEISVIADVDGDGTYDYLYCDANGDGIIQDDELFDISEARITSDDIDSLPLYNA